MDEGFLRQRRNLISTSVALMLFMIADGEIISLFGIQLKHGYVALIFTWVGFFYFWWRCSIYGPNSIDDAFGREKFSFQNNDPFTKKSGINKLKELINEIDPDVQVSFGKQIDNQWYFTYAHGNINLNEKYRGLKSAINQGLLRILLIRGWFRTAYYGR